MNPEQLIIDEITFYRHPIYQNYYSDINGHIYSSLTNKAIRIRTKKNGYRDIGISTSEGRKFCLVHRFIWECFHGVIPDEKQIDHLNRNREDNRLCNLRVVKRRTNHYNKCTNRSVHVDALPDDAIQITEFKDDAYENYFYCPADNHVYWVNEADDEIIQLYNTPNRQVYMYDVNNDRRINNINTIRKSLLGE